MLQTTTGRHRSVTAAFLPHRGVLLAFPHTRPHHVLVPGATLLVIIANAVS